MKRKFIITFALLIALSGISAPAPAQPLEGLEPYAESFAYKQYSMRPKNELSKLYYLMDRYRGSDLKVVFNGSEYESRQALGYAKSYLMKNYKKENALNWIKLHAYRSPSGQVIYLKTLDGKNLVLRDVLIKELEALGS